MFTKFLIKGIKNHRIQYLVSVLCIFFLFQIVLSANGILLDAIAKSTNEYNNAKHISINFWVVDNEIVENDAEIEEFRLNLSDPDDRALIDDFLSDIRNITDIKMTVFNSGGLDKEKYYSNVVMTYAFDDYESLKNWWCDEMGMNESEIPTKAQYENGEKVVIASPKSEYSDGVSSYRYADDNHIYIGENDTVCTVTGVWSNGYCPVFIYGCEPPDNLKIDHLSVHLKHIPTDEQIEQMTRVIEKYFGTHIYAEIPDTSGLMEIRKNTANIVLTLLLLVMAVFNVIIIFRQMVDWHKKEFAVYSLCGFKKGTEFLYSFCEMNLISLFSFVCGSLFFNTAIKPVLSDSFGIVTAVFTLDYYIILILAFIVLSAVMFTICIAPKLRENLVRQLAEL